MESRIIHDLSGKVDVPTDLAKIKFEEKHYVNTRVSTSVVENITRHNLLTLHLDTSFIDIKF